MGLRIVGSSSSSLILACRYKLKCIEDVGINFEKGLGLFAEVVTKVTVEALCNVVLIQIEKEVTKIIVELCNLGLSGFTMDF